MVLVGALEAWIETGDGPLFLTSHRYAPDVIHPDGFRRITAFEWRPWPAWTYQVKDGLEIAHELFCESSTGQVVLSWRLLRGSRRIWRYGRCWRHGIFIRCNTKTAPVRGLRPLPAVTSRGSSTRTALASRCCIRPIRARPGVVSPVFVRAGTRTWARSSRGSGVPGVFSFELNERHQKRPSC